MLSDAQTLQFLEALEEKLERRRRLPLHEVTTIFQELFPHLLGQPTFRLHLRQILDISVDRGKIRFPRSKKLFDHMQNPPLPRWIEVVVNAPPAEQVQTPCSHASQRAWHPALFFANHLPRLTEKELETLLRIQCFLAREPHAEFLTVRERSLRLFGDDKRLESLAKGRLFGNGRLSYELLRCREVHLPIVTFDCGRGQNAIIIENKDTFQSMCRAVESEDIESTIRFVLFGSGNAVTRSIYSLRDWQTLPSRLFYFGDLDLRGLQIATGLRDVVRHLHWLPPLECADVLYCALQESGKRLDIRLQGRKCSSEFSASVTSWLPLPIRHTVGELLQAGGRWPQELLTTFDMAPLLALLGH